MIPPIGAKAIAMAIVLFIAWLLIPKQEGGAKMREKLAKKEWCEECNDECAFIPNVNAYFIPKTMMEVCASSIDATEICWTCRHAKSKHREMREKSAELLKEKEK